MTDINFLDADAARAAQDRDAEAPDPLPDDVDVARPGPSQELVDAGRDWGKPLTEADARALTTQIRLSVEELLPLIRTAYRRRADLALGYGSWTQYCDAELVGLRLTLGARQETTQALRAEGMSTRAIAAAVGTSEATVRRDLADTPAPAAVAGLDGKSYQPTRSTPSETAAGDRDVREQSPADGAATTPGEGRLPGDALAAPAPSPVRAPVPGEGVTPTEATPASVVAADPPADDQSGRGFAAPDAGADHPRLTGEEPTPGSAVAGPTATRESTEALVALEAGADLTDPGPVPEPPLPGDLTQAIDQNLTWLDLAVGDLATQLREADPHAGNYLDTLRHCRHNLDLLIRAAETADA